MTELEPGTRIGEVTVEALAASGGFGAVYRARDSGGRQVALKVLLGELAASEQAALRFEREIEILGRIRHGHVVEVVSVGRLPDRRPYYVMEWLAGEDLAHRIGRRGRLAPAAALAVVEPVASALDAAHAAGVIHRDVTAGNVFLAAPDDRAVLLDFGIAKLLDADFPVTASRQVLGTATAMAPEQATGADADARTDVYGLGALIYHMLAGAPPFAGESATIARQLHRFARRPRVSAVLPACAAVDDVVARAMSIRPCDRYASAGALAAAMREAVAEAPLPARSVRALAVHVEVTGEADVMPQILRHFEDHGFMVVLQGSWSAVFVRELDDGARAAADGLALPGMTLRTRIGDADVAGRHVTGGALLDLRGWQERE